MATKKEIFDLFEFGYFDTVISGRTGVSLEKVRELRILYNVFKK